MRRRAAAALAVLALATLLAASGAVSFARREYRRTLRARHAARGETELRLVNPAGARLSLRLAGASLDAAAEAKIPQGECWLGAGRYFVEAALDGRVQRFPVTLEPPVDAPDGDHVWTVTVRHVAAEAPPRLDERDPSFVFVPGGAFVIGDRLSPGQTHAVWVAATRASAATSSPRRS